MRAPSRVISLSRALGVAALAMLAGACQTHYGSHHPGQYAEGRNVADPTRGDQYLDRRDTISASAGNAQATNRILMMQDPWPRGAWNRTIPHDGVRMGNSIDYYREPRPEADPTQSANQALTSGPTADGI